MKESFSNNSGGQVEYFTVSDGAFVKRVKEPTEASTTRTNKNGQEVHEERYKALTGRIVYAEIREGQYGKDWSFTVLHGGGKYIIQMPYGSRYATDLAKRFRNLRTTEAIRLMPWMMTDETTGKKRSGLSLSQIGEDGQLCKVEPFYTRDSAEQLPQLKQVKVSGKMLWDRTELDEAVEAILLQFNSQQASEPMGENNEPEEEAPF